MSEDEGEVSEVSEGEEDLKENVLGDEDRSEEEIKEEPTPFEEENKKILSDCSRGAYEKEFHKLFLGLLDFGKAYHNSKKSFTEALLNTGSKENPQDIYAFIETMSSRLEKVYIVKRMCAVLGLHSEMENILEAEMELIYKSPNIRQPTPVNYGDLVAGEMQNGQK